MRKFVLLIPFLLLCLSGCKKDPSPGSWNQEDELLADQYDAAAMMLSDLLGEEVTPEKIDALKEQKPEPRYGTIFDDSAPFDRTVTVDDAQEAEDLFRGLGGWRDDVVQETADGYIIDFSSIGVGKLEFFRQGDGSNVGFASVDIPFIPHLQRITYKTKEQAGINDETFSSPARYGDVYLHENRYYICVRQSTGYSYDSEGFLVCVETGKGTNWKDYLSSETWGCWRPKQNWTNSRYIVAFLKLCADKKFMQDKAQIVKKFPGKVFPLCQRWYDYDDQRNIGDYTWGFGALEPGYSHVTRYHADFSLEKSHSDKPSSDWKDVRVIVARDATEGDYRASKARWWRRFHHYVLPWICKLDKGIFAETHKYTSKGGWQDIFDGAPIIYTLNAVSFTDALPDGYVLQDIWGEEDDWDDDGYVRVRSEAQINVQISLNANAMIRLGTDIKLTKSVIIEGDRNITIDLAGHTLDRGCTAQDKTGMGQVFGVRRGATLSLSNGTLTGGWGGDGGGIYNVGTVNLQNVKIERNVGNDRGGGIANHGTVTMTDCTVSNNGSVDNTTLTGGGGIFNYEGATATLTRVYINRNDCSKAGGAGLVNMGTATLNDCTFINNDAPTNGGGVWNSGTLTVNGGEITYNEAKSGGGGGIFVKEGSTVTLDGVTVESNKSSTGGGIYIQSNASVNVKGKLVVRSNSATVQGNNLYISEGNVLKVCGAFSSSSIYVTRAEGTGVLTDGYSAYNVSVDPEGIFHSDNTDYKVILSEGEACLAINSTQ